MFVPSGCGRQAPVAKHLALRQAWLDHDLAQAGMGVNPAGVRTADRKVQLRRSGPSITTSPGA